jgi:hypothetical protein
MSICSAAPFFFLLAAAAAQTTLVIPPGYANMSGGTSFAMPFAGPVVSRAEMIHDSSAFTSQGVATPIVITRLRYRVAVGQQWLTSGFATTVDMSTCPVDHSAASTTFDLNHGADRINVFNGGVTFQQGSTPGPVVGTWEVDLPLSAPFFYDPALGDLTVDVNVAGTPTSLTPPEIDWVNEFRQPPALCTCVSDTGSGAAINDNWSPVCEFTWFVAPGYAAATPIGTGCYATASSFYEAFAPGTFDLGGAGAQANSILMMPTPDGGYAVLPGSGVWFTGGAFSLGLTDDSVSPPQVLPFAFQTPVRTTTSLVISSNGFVWTQPNSDAGCCSFDPSDLLDGAERYAPLWSDFQPSLGGQVYFEIDPSGTAAYVTWGGMAERGAQNNLSNFQIAFFNSGLVEYRWRACNIAASQALVGWSPGQRARDPGQRDLSVDMPFATRADARPLQLTATGRPVLGTSFDLLTWAIPSGTAAGILVLSLGQANPAIDLSSFGMPGCFQYVAPGVTSFFTISTPLVHTHLAVPNIAGLAGHHVFGQSLTFSSGYNAFGAIVSNGIDLLPEVH